VAVEVLEALEALEELEAVGELEALGELDALGELEADAEVLGLGLLVDGDAGADAGAELFVTAGVVGAVWLELVPVPGLVAWCPARAKARAAAPAPTTMATASTIASRAGRRERDRLAAGA
jgi:hypothetical protein